MIVFALVDNESLMDGSLEVEGIVVIEAGADASVEIDSGTEGDDSTSAGWIVFFSLISFSAFGAWEVTSDDFWRSLQ